MQPPRWPINPRPHLTRFFLPAALTAAALLTSPTLADFTLNDTVTTSNGFDDHVLKIFNDGTNGTGTKLEGLDISLDTPGNTTATAMKVKFVDTDGDGVPDANILGQTNLSFGNTANGTFIRLGFSLSFQIALVSPSHYQTDPDDTGTPTTTLSPSYTNLHSFEVAALNGQNNGVIANTGAGASFANVVVPHGTPLLAFGQVGGDTGPAPFVTFQTQPFPPLVLAVTTINPPGFGNALGFLSYGAPNQNTFQQITGLNTATGFVRITNFGPTADNTVFALDLLVNGLQATPAQIATLTNEINQANSPNIGISLASATDPAHIFPTNYNLFLTPQDLDLGDNTLSFNFQNITDIPNITVTAISFVPEPTSLTVAAVALSTLTLRRPKQKAHG